MKFETLSFGFGFLLSLKEHYARKGPRNISEAPLLKLFKMLIRRAPLKGGG